MNSLNLPSLTSQTKLFIPTFYIVVDMHRLLELLVARVKFDEKNEKSGVFHNNSEKGVNRGKSETPKNDTRLVHETREIIAVRAEHRM